MRTPAGLSMTAEECFRELEQSVPRSLAGNAGPIHFLGSGRNFRDGFPSA